MKVYTMLFYMLDQSSTMWLADNQTSLIEYIRVQKRYLSTFSGFLFIDAVFLATEKLLTTINVVGTHNMNLAT